MSENLQSRDLDELFQWLRFRSFGNKAVADIGNFVAHADERDSGVSWKGVQSFSHVLDYQIPRIMALDRAPASPNDKESFAKVVLATLHLMPPSKVKASTHLGKRKAEKLVHDALNKVIAFNGTRLDVSDDMTDQQLELLNYFSSFVLSQPAFTGEDLAKQFAAVLQKNELIDENQKLSHIVCEFVAIYAVEKMNGSRLILEDGKDVQLWARVDQSGWLEVVVLCPLSDTPKQTTVSSAIYTTECKATDWCSPELIKIQQPWEMPLEINGSGRLQML